MPVVGSCRRTAMAKRAEEAQGAPSGASPTKVEEAYRVDPEGRFIVRTAAPNVRLYVDRKLTVVENDRDRYPEQTLFLDGVFNGPPFMDNERRHYALDH